MRVPLLALAALSAWAIPAAAQQAQWPPVAIALVADVTTDQQTGVTTVTLDGSRSFDPQGSITQYDWEVMTDAYAGFPVAQSPADPANNIPAGLTAEFRLTRQALAAKQAYSIEFRLTVTDDGTPKASDSATVTADINQSPTAEITVEAWLPAPRGEQFYGFDDDGDGEVDENSERYTRQGVIHGPGEADNADNEWDIREGSLLVVDGTASSDPDGPLPDSAFSWERIYASDIPTVTASVPDDTDSRKTLSTDDDPDTAGTTDDETIAPLPFTGGVRADPYYLYYRLTVTDDHGASATEVVKIVVRDAHADPQVEIEHPESDPAASTAEDRRAGIQPAGENRYVISTDAAHEGVALIAVATGDGAARTRLLEHTWSGTGIEPGRSNRPGSRTTATFTAPEGTKEGDAFTAAVEVVDPGGLTGSVAVELVVADNSPPTATAPDDIDTPDGIDGGYPPSDPPTGTVSLRGFAFDPDGDPLAYRWMQVRTPSGAPLDVTYRGPRLSLSGATTPTASFRLPEVTTGTQIVLYVQFTAADRWGVEASDTVQITIRDGDDDLKALAGTDQTAQPGEIVVLRGNFSSGLVRADAISAVTYSWAYTGIDTHPRTEHRPPITDAEAAEGFAYGKWFPNADGTYDSAAGGRVGNADSRFPYFIVPEPGGFNSVKLTFELTVRSGADTDTDTIAITVVNTFFSGTIDSPDYCANLSLGGPITHPMDLDGDGTADVCSLNTTRRAAIARQYALEKLATLNPDALTDALHGPPDDPTTPDADESDPAKGACHTAPKDLDGDTPEALAADICAPQNAARRDLPQQPGPVDPSRAARFYSSYIDSAFFCANYGLGGPRLYAHDSDGDGTADTCALPYTRREAAARQAALEAAFAGHPQYPAALAAACRALGTLDFGDHPADLAQDHCNPDHGRPKGQPLPTPG
ncbi:PKD domain-containing protein [Candidatus Poriferisocius sp.]|uniref:PKD domain-containing protein n=1 Tax=Candidatus Poriferisocius sp. TaxID=3101276 RepID=UPI003B02BF2D